MQNMTPYKYIQKLSESKLNQQKNYPMNNEGQSTYFIIHLAKYETQKSIFSLFFVHHHAATVLKMKESFDSIKYYKVMSVKNVNLNRKNQKNKQNLRYICNIATPSLCLSFGGGWKNILQYLFVWFCARPCI